MTEKEYKNRLKDKIIIYRDILNLPSYITFGIEIEYENVALKKITDILNYEKISNRFLCGWNNKREYDILEYNRNGEEVNGEIISSIFTDEKRTWQSLKDILELIKDNQGVVTEKCGGHVNIGSHILGKNVIYWRNFFLLWLLYEEEIYKFSTGEFIEIRNDNDLLFQKISSELVIDNILNTSNKKLYLSNVTESILDKFHDVYINKPVEKEIRLGNLIEFRLPNGTLEEAIWQNDINFFSNFLLTCKEDLDVERILYKIKNKDHNSIELSNLIFKNQIDKDNFLIQTLKTNKIYKKELPKHIIY